MPKILNKYSQKRNIGASHYGTEVVLVREGPIGPGLSPNIHIHVSVSELYIPTMGLPVLLEEICRLILGIYV
jgi:hypothetical protein